MRAVIAWFAENHVAANLLMVLIVVAGVASLSAIQQKSFPDINIEVIQVGVTYLGAAPEEVEEGVCIRIEEEIGSVAGIERLTSTAREGFCSVDAELIGGTSIDRAAVSASSTSLRSILQVWVAVKSRFTSAGVL